MARRLSLQLADVAKAQRAQQRWLADHGGNLDGYLARYGDEGRQIYIADLAELSRRNHAFDAVVEKVARKYKRSLKV